MPRMYFIHRGELCYTSMAAIASKVVDGEWLCEQTLWTYWTHHGALQATRDSLLYTVDANKFQNIVSHFEHEPGFQPKDYAVNFVREFNTMADLHEVTDLHFTAEEYQHITEACHEGEVDFHEQVSMSSAMSWVHSVTSGVSSHMPISADVSRKSDEFVVPSRARGVRFG